MRRAPHTTAPASCALALALLAGCTGPNSPEQTILRVGDGVHDVFRGHTNAKSQTIRFETTGVVGVDIDNFGGDVEIVADPGATGIIVTIRREGTHGFLRGGESKASLELIAATTEMEPGDLGPVLAIRTWSTADEPWFQASHIRIEAPAVDGVRVNTTRGTVLAKGVGGQVDIQNGGGSVRLMTDRPMREAVIVVAREGDIDYRVGRDSAGFFDVETVGGTVRLRSAVGGWIMHPEQSRRDHLYGTLNGGTNRILLRTVDGDIRVAIVDDPTQAGMIIVDP